MHRLLSLRPLPLHCSPEAEGLEETSASGGDSGESEDSEQETEGESPPTKIEIDNWKQKRREKQERLQREERKRRELESEERRRQKELEDSHGRRKKKKKKPVDSEDSEEETHTSVSYSEEYLHSQKHQRVSNHPSMPNAKKKDKTTKKKAKTTRREPQDSDAEATEVSTLGSLTVTESKLKEARKQIARDKLEKIQSELTKYSLSSKKGKPSCMEGRFHETSRKFLFKKVKFTTERFLPGHIDWVITYLAPAELDEFEEFPDLQKKAVEAYHARYADAVRQGINAAHNQKRQDFMKIWSKMPEDDFNPKGYPLTGKEMEDLVFRKGMGPKDANREATIQQWAVVIDEILPKVSDSQARADETEA